MARLFHTMLFAATAALAVQVWVRHDGTRHLSGVIGTREARAQSASEGASAMPAGGATGAVPLDNAQVLARTKVLARVGNEAILAGEVAGAVNEALGRLAREVPAEQLPAYRDALTRQRLKELIDTKLVLADAREKIPAENLPKVEEKLKEQFEKEELAKLLARTGAASRAQLDAGLRRLGSSLEREERAFVERTLARGWVRQQIDYDEEVTHQEMLAYYHEHPTDYEYPARARWEHLMVQFSKYRSKHDAWNALCNMGNQVIEGTPFAEVAQARSDGPTADQGGWYDWTTERSLVSTVLDHAIFSLPLGALSPILEDDRGFHIVRVVQRSAAGRTPFTEAQVEIKKRIRGERIDRQIKEYLALVREKTPVWTIYDRPAAGQEGLGRAGGLLPR